MFCRRASAIAVSVRALVALVATAGARSAAANPIDAHVTVVRPEGGDPVMREVATRAWAELTAGGVEATLIDCVPDDCHMDGVAPYGLTLTLATFRRVDETVTRVDLSVRGRRDPVAAKTVVVAGAGTAAASDARTIAIRAVELAHATLLDADRAAPAVVGSRSDDEIPGSLLRPPPPRRPNGWSVGAGFGVMHSFGGFASEVGATGEVAWLSAGGLGFRALLGVAAFGDELITIRGQLAMRQDLAVVQAMRRFRNGARIQPYVALGLGLYHVSARFTVFPQGSSDSLWAGLLVGGGGATLRLTDTIALSVGTQLMVADPHPAVVLTTGGVATGGNPSLLSSLGVQKTF